jgi:hypothetical protein
VKRALALALLVLVAFFVGATGVDACDDDGDCAPGCHVSCRDGCGSAPVTEAERIRPSPARLLGEPVAGATRLLDRATQPETGPPRI